MIKTLHIAGFKRFARCDLDLAPLTVLAGLNAAGKTSVIQALLLAREASLSETQTVALNGPFGMELGCAQDVLNLDTATETPTISISAQIGDVLVRFSLDASNETLFHLPIAKREPQPAPAPLGGSHRSFAYLSAERLGPRDILSTSTLPMDLLGVGVRGEFCAHVLSVHGLKHKVALERRHPERPTDVDSFLKYQVEAWLSDIVRPTEIDPIVFPGTSATALRFRVPGGDWVRAPNMGFGVSYSLPVVLAGLFVPDDGLLIVENPEAHLHPAGQSRMGVFLATLAAAGLQVLLETHSDHVLNGIRRTIAVLGKLDADKALVHFFDDPDRAAGGLSTLRFTKTGNLSEWPPRFFDQFQMDVAELSRVRRERAR